MCKLKAFKETENIFNRKKITNKGTPKFELNLSIDMVIRSSNICLMSIYPPKYALTFFLIVIL